MAKSISKRSFLQNTTLELFQRQDGEYCLKYIGVTGDELNIKLSRKPYMPLSTGEQYFQEWFDQVVDRVNARYRDKLAALPEGSNDCELQWFIVAELLCLSEFSLQGGARYFATATDITSSKGTGNTVGLGQMASYAEVESDRQHGPTPAEVQLQEALQRTIRHLDTIASRAQVPVTILDGDDQIDLLDIRELAAGRPYKASS